MSKRMKGNKNMLGKHLSKESRKKISESNKGKKLSEETKRKIKEARARQIITEETKKKISNSLKGHEVSKETRKNMKGHSGVYIRDEETKQKIRKARKKQVFPIRDTSIEIKIQNFLNELNINFLKHQYMEIEHGYQCDILVPSMNLVIECDGDWWHGNRNIFPRLNEMQLKQIEEDKIRTQELIESGFKILRFWECDIREMKLKDFKEKIKKGGKK